ncbi:MAG TPA: glycosyltransferase [Opitutaceae bacterium]|nr:glycosyltransferase [Opitutaceae bacterium]
MKIVIFGLTLSSSWGNGHATLWRGLIHALGRRGHDVVFFERDAPYYAEHRDLTELSRGELRLYRTWDDVVSLARREAQTADAAIVTSYCPDSHAASAMLDESDALRVFYDLDTPVTLAQLKAGATVPYVPPNGLRDFDLVLSFTGGRALDELREHLGAVWVEPLYGSVDPAVHRPVSPVDQYRADLSYLGTYAEDRQAVLEALFVETARRCPDRRFVIGGAQYPHRFPWTDNIYFLRHLEPARHPEFFSSSRLTLNVTREAMRQMGYCPSGRLFEAAACGTPVVSDTWEGLETFFAPDREILLANSADDIERVMDSSDEELQRLGQAARERVLSTHTADHRAVELEIYLERGMARTSEGPEEIETATTGEI